MPLPLEVPDAEIPCVRVADVLMLAVPEELGVAVGDCEFVDAGDMLDDWVALCCCDWLGVRVPL